MERVSIVVTIAASASMLFLYHKVQKLSKKVRSLDRNVINIMDSLSNLIGELDERVCD